MKREETTSASGLQNRDSRLPLPYRSKMPMSWVPCRIQGVYRCDEEKLRHICPLVMTNIAKQLIIEHGPVEIVELALEHLVT